MIFRIATADDISQIQLVRNVVKENRLSNPSLISDALVLDYLENRCASYVCEINDRIVGFSMIDFVENNVWALFILPEVEGKGIGKKLHQLILDDYFSKRKEKLWLSTEPNSRAEKFYEKQGWKNVGFHGDEIKFEMSFEDWKK